MYIGIKHARLKLKNFFKLFQFYQIHPFHPKPFSSLKSHNSIAVIIYFSLKLLVNFINYT